MKLQGEKKQNILNSKVYLCGKEIMGRKTVYYALQTIFGIGETRAKHLCNWLKHHYNIEATEFIGNVDEQTIKILNDFINSTFLTEGDLKKLIDANIELKVRIQCREGKRLKLGLPLHGRTKTNGQTARRKKKNIVVDIKSTNKK